MLSQSHYINDLCEDISRKLTKRWVVWSYRIPEEYDITEIFRVVSSYLQLSLGITDPPIFAEGYRILQINFEDYYSDLDSLVEIHIATIVSTLDYYYTTPHPIRVPLNMDIHLLLCKLEKKLNQMQLGYFTQIMDDVIYLQLEGPVPEKHDGLYVEPPVVVDYSDMDLEDIKANCEDIQRRLTDNFSNMHMDTEFTETLLPPLKKVAFVDNKETNSLPASKNEDWL